MGQPTILAKEQSQSQSNGSDTQFTIDPFKLENNKQILIDMLSIPNQSSQLPKAGTPPIKTNSDEKQMLNEFKAFVNAVLANQEAELEICQAQYKPGFIGSFFAPLTLFATLIAIGFTLLAQVEDGSSMHDTCLAAIILTLFGPAIQCLEKLDDAPSSSTLLKGPWPQSIPAVLLIAISIVLKCGDPDSHVSDACLGTITLFCVFAWTQFHAPTESKSVGILLAAALGAAIALTETGVANMLTSSFLLAASLGFWIGSRLSLLGKHRCDKWEVSVSNSPKKKNILLTSTIRISMKGLIN